MTTTTDTTTHPQPSGTATSIDATTRRLFVGATAAIAVAPLLPWVHDSGLINADVTPTPGVVMTCFGIAGLLAFAALHVHRGDCRSRVLLAALVASALSVAIAVIVVLVCQQNSNNGFETASAGPGCDLLFAGGAAGFVAHRRLRRQLRTGQ